MLSEFGPAPAGRLGKASLPFFRLALRPFPVGHCGRTKSRLFAVAGESRIKELVRMLGGGGESARALAESLLEG